MCFHCTTLDFWADDGRLVLNYDVCLQNILHHRRRRRRRRSRLVCLFLSITESQLVSHIGGDK